MTDPDETYTTQDTGEATDEDELREDPLEEGMDPPEHWSGATKYGMTAFEQSHPRGLDERLAEEEPDVTPGSAPQAVGAVPVEVDTEGIVPPPGRDYEEELGISADIAGGSVPEQIRTPEPPE